MNELMPEQRQTDNLGPAYYDLEFPWTSPPLTANQRHHWARKSRITAAVRDTARYAAWRLPALARCEVTLTWYVNTKHRRDADNIVPTLKALCDGLVDAGVVIDDTPDLMKKLMPVITYDTTVTPHMVLRVARILPEAAAA